MANGEREPMPAETIGPASVYSLEELCQSCQGDVAWISELVEQGVIEPQGRSRSEWRFSSVSVVLAAKAKRFDRDLGSKSRRHCARLRPPERDRAAACPSERFRERAKLTCRPAGRASSTALKSSTRAESSCPESTSSRSATPHSITFIGSRPFHRRRRKSAHSLTSRAEAAWLRTLQPQSRVSAATSRSGRVSAMIFGGDHSAAT